MREEDTRLVPYSPAEGAWCVERPGPHRVPPPVAGDEVEYRADPWGPVRSALVRWVQPLDDVDDPHLWRVQTDPMTGAVALLDGRPVLEQSLDPWPMVRLYVAGLGEGLSREARLRGSAGWLPLDWRTRYRPLPASVVISAAAPVVGPQHLIGA